MTSNRRNIIVIGASTGGFNAIKKIIAGLPSNMKASIFVVWHISPDIKDVLPRTLNQLMALPAANGIDNENIFPGRIYIAPPDHHLLIEKDHIRITRGPKENRFRPAIDPLFRSAAYAYREQVIGIILTGALDDGTAGLWTVKEYGGIAIVQDPEEAEVPSMPENAIRSVNVDHIVAVNDIAPLLLRLVEEPIKEEKKPHADTSNIPVEVKIAMEDDTLDRKIFELGDLSPYTCPECHGVLTALKEGSHTRFRCHTGHAFTADSLLAAITEEIEAELWSAVKSMQESVMLLNHMGDHFAEINQPKIASLYFKKAKEAEEREGLVRKAILSHEHLSTDNILQEASNKR